MAIFKQPDAEYFAMPGISNSYMGRYLISPAAAMIQTKSTSAMTLGGIVHCMFLEGMDTFFSRYCVAPKFDKRTKVDKEGAKLFAADNPGKEVVTAEDFTKAQAMLASLMSWPGIKSICNPWEPEMTITWVDEASNLPCKAKADLLGATTLLDFKTTSEHAGNPAKWYWKCIQWNYHRQMAFYVDGCRANGMDVKDVLIVAVDSVAPYTCGVYSIHPAMLEDGRKQYREILTKIADTKQDNVYPSYNYSSIVEIGQPKDAPLTIGGSK